MNEQELKVKDVSTETLKKVIEMRESDPYAKFREAQGRGEVIQLYDNGCWNDMPYIFFECWNIELIRIKPKTKKIDHSMLVGADVLCQFKDDEEAWDKCYSKLQEIFSPVHANRYRKEDFANYKHMRVAFDIPQVHTGDKCPVPEGYEFEVMTALGWRSQYFFWWINSEISGKNWSQNDRLDASRILAYKVTGIAEGWEL